MWSSAGRRRLRRCLFPETVFLGVLLTQLLLFLTSTQAASISTDGSSRNTFLRSLQNSVVGVDNSTLDQDQDQKCPPCPACKFDATSFGDADGDEPIAVQILMLDSQGIIDMVSWNAQDYERHTNGRVKIEIKRTPSMPALFEEIENDARSGGGLFDAYYTNPTILGTAAMLNGFMEV